MSKFILTLRIELKTIYETNLRSAYMKGRFDRSYESDAHPYLATAAEANV